MNKITIDKDSKLFIDEDTFITYEGKDLNIDLTIKDDIKVFEYIENKNLKITYNIKGKATINKFAVDSTIENDLNLNEEGANIIYNYSSLNNEDNKYIVNINHNKRDTKSMVVSHAINFTSSKLSFLINTNIYKDSINVISNQDSKIILRDKNNSVIEPNLFVENSMIDANHSAYLGTFKENDIFYLESRAIKRNVAERILAKAFLINKMDLSFKEKELIINKLSKYWR